MFCKKKKSKKKSKKKEKRKKGKTLLASYLEHLCPADRADALRGRLAVFHSYSFLILHGPFGFTFNAICLCCHGECPILQVYKQ
jgi:hypothetical protein